MKIGIASLAHVHGPHYAHWLRGQDLLGGVWDDDIERGTTVAATYGVPFHAQIQDLFADVDAVVVCSENARHAEFAVAATRAGRHVLVEKPFATTVADAEAMMAAAAEAGVVLMNALPCRFHPSYVELRDAVRSGAIGDIVAIAATNHGYFPKTWFDDPELAGGGAIMDHTVHVADLLRDLLGSEVRSVYALADTRMDPSCRSEDVAYMSLEYENGVIASIDPSWSRPAGDVWMEVVGTSGTATLDMFSQTIRMWSGARSDLYWGQDAIALMFNAFVDACTNGKPAPISGDDGLRALEVALLAYRSVREERTVAR